MFTSVKGDSMANDSEFKPISKERMAAKDGKLHEEPEGAMEESTEALEMMALKQKQNEDLESTGYKPILPFLKTPAEIKARRDKIAEYNKGRPELHPANIMITPVGDELSPHSFDLINRSRHWGNPKK